MNNLDDVQQKMSDLYAAVESGAMELKQADSLANIAGKYLKAEQLKLAKEVFRSQRGQQLFPSAQQLITSGKRDERRSA
jgi:hypothetical protein